MKWIIAIIQPHQLEAVREALGGIGIEGMTVTEVKGYGRQRGHTEIYRGAEYQVKYMPKVKVEVMVDDSVTDQAVETIRAAAQTGRIGDGKIFVVDMGTAIRIRTGEMDGEAL